MEKTGTKIDDFDLIEANEAFAAQALADGENWAGTGAASTSTAARSRWATRSAPSGARVLVTLLHAMKDRGAKTGLATLCLGGGNAVALAVELRRGAERDDGA